MSRSARPSPAVLALALVAFTIGVAEFSVTGLLPDIAATYGVTVARMSAAISVYALGAVVGAPTIAVLGARLPRKRLLLLLAVFVLIGNGASMLAPSAELFVVARFLAGLPHGAFFAVAAASIVSLVPPGRRGQSIAMMFVGQTVATIVGVPTAAWLGQAVGWQVAFGVVVLTGSAALLALARHVPVLVVEPWTGLRGQVAAVRGRALWSTLATGAVGLGGVFGVLAFLAPITEAGGVDLGWMPVVMVLFGVGTTAGALVGGRNADRDPVRATHHGLAFTAGTLVVVALGVGTAWVPFVAALLVGLSLQLLVPALQLRAVSAAPAAPVLGGALNQSALNIANALGTAVVAAAIGGGSALLASPLIGLGFVTAGIVIALATRGWVPSAGRLGAADEAPAEGSAAEVVSHVTGLP